MYKKKVRIAQATIIMQAFCNTHGDFHMEKTAVLKPDMTNTLVSILLAACTWFQAVVYGLWWNTRYIDLIFWKRENLDFEKILILEVLS